MRRETRGHAGSGTAWAALVLGCGFTAACGPIEYIANTPLEAAGAIGEAKHVKAEKYAPYEMTAADEYIHKSRELAGYARFHSSVRFAQTATRLAREAHTIALDKAQLPEEQREGKPIGGGNPGETHSGSETPKGEK